MTRKIIRSDDPWDLDEQQSDLRLLGYREVTGREPEPGEFRKLSEVDDDDRRPVVTLEWEDGARE